MSHTEHELLSVLDVLYEGMLDDEAWQRALLRVADFVSGAAVTLFSLNPGTAEVYRCDLARLDSALMKQYHDTWMPQDPRHTAGLSCTIGEPQVDGMLVDTRSYHRSAVFNDLFMPADLPYLLATWLERRPSRGVVLSVLGSRPRGEFSEDQRRKMASLIPHIRRIVEVKDRLARAQIIANGMLETMDRLPFGLILLAENLEILEASASARSLLARRIGIHADSGRLGFVRSVDERAFVERLREDPGRARLDDTIRLSWSDSRQPLSLLVLPLKASQAQWTTPSACWLVLVFDPETSPITHEVAVQRALGVTRAEAALAQRIANGLSVAQAAEQLCISVSTARTQLKSIYAKVGVSSQAQLVRRVLTGPALVSHRLEREK